MQLGSPRLPNAKGRIINAEWLQLQCNVAFRIQHFAFLQTAHRLRRGTFSHKGRR
jgi:hypothetical protein